VLLKNKINLRNWCIFAGFTIESKLLASQEGFCSNLLYSYLIKHSIDHLMLLEFFSVAKGEDGETHVTSQMEALLYLLFVNFQVFYCLQNK
jgi:hypothetical protein